MYRSLPNAASPVIAVYPGLVVAYDDASGQELWSHRARGPEFPGERPTSIAVTDDRVYVLTTQLAPAKGFLEAAKVYVELVALDYATGAPIWTQVVDRGVPYAQTLLLVKGDQVFVAHADVLVAIAADTGTIRWCREVKPLLAIALPDGHVGR